MLLTFSLWLDLIFDEFIVNFKSKNEQRKFLKCGRTMFWESFDSPNVIWDHTKDQGY